MKRTIFVILALLLAFPPGVFAQDDAEQEPVELRYSAWVSPSRQEMLNTLFDLYEEQNPNITIVREFSDFGGYWDVLATQTAGGNPPDLMTFLYNFKDDYASRGVLLDMTPYIEDETLDLSDIPQGVRVFGETGDEYHLVIIGSTAPALFYNETMIEEAGMEMPEMFESWDQFKEFSLELTENLPEGNYALEDAGRLDAIFNFWLRQQGKSFFDGETLGFEQEDLVNWWTLWSDLREAGAIPDAETFQEFAFVPTQDSLFANSRAAMRITNANQLPTYQQYSEDVFSLQMLPRGEFVGDYLGAAFLAVAAETEHPEEAIALLNFIINTPEAAVLMATEYGPPGSTAMQEVVRPTFDESQQKVLNYVGEVSDILETPVAIPPERGNEVEAAYLRFYEETTFNLAPLDDVVSRFFQEAETILGSDS